MVITAGLLVNQQVKVLSKKRSHPEKPYNAHRKISHDAHLGVPQSAGRTPRRKNPQVRGLPAKATASWGISRCVSWGTSGCGCLRACANLRVARGRAGQDGSPNHSQRLVVQIPVFKKAVHFEIRVTVWNFGHRKYGDHRNGPPTSTNVGACTAPTRKPAQNFKQLRDSRSEWAFLIQVFAERSPNGRA